MGVGVLAVIYVCVVAKRAGYSALGLASLCLLAGYSVLWQVVLKPDIFPLLITSSVQLAILFILLVR